MLYCSFTVAVKVPVAMVNRKLLTNGLIRAGFTLSRAMFRKMWGPSTGTVDSIFQKKLATFLVITDHRMCVSYQFSKTGELFLLITLILTQGSHELSELEFK